MCSEYLSLGGRYIVRGFDGEQTLAAERGWYWRNTLTQPIGNWPLMWYAGWRQGVGKHAASDGFSAGVCVLKDVMQRFVLPLSLTPHVGTR